MIDFRYHLVSLISVFLALAVGIALGAGPLQESIGDTLTGQVEQLRSERADLRADLDVAQADLRRADAALDATSGDLLDGVLGDRHVALVTVDGVDEDVLEGLRTRIAQAGGSVTATATVTDVWVDPAQSAFRQSLAGRLVEYLEPRPAEDGGTEVELAEALVQGLTTAAADDPDATADDAALVLELLQEAGLVELEGSVAAPADAVVVVAGPVVSAVQAREDEQTLQEQEPEEVDAEVERHDALARTAVLLARTAQTRTLGAVLAGGDTVPNGVLESVRQDQDSARVLTTVESVQRTSGQVAVPLALAARIAGDVAHVGAGASADRAMPARTVLPPVQRVVTPPEDAEGADGVDGDGAPGGTDGEEAEGGEPGADDGPDDAGQTDGEGGDGA